MEKFFIQCPFCCMINVRGQHDLCVGCGLELARLVAKYGDASGVVAAPPRRGKGGYVNLIPVSPLGESATGAASQIVSAMVAASVPQEVAVQTQVLDTGEVVDETISAAPAPAPEAESLDDIFNGFLSGTVDGAGLVEDDDRTVVRAAEWYLVVDGTGLRYPIFTSPTVIGRKPRGSEGEGTILVADPERKMSRSHAKITLDEAKGVWLIEDLGSANGTWVGGQQIGDGESVPVTGQIGLGEVRMTIEKAQSD